MVHHEGDLKSGKKDFSTAILERKKLTNRPVVDEAVYDDNSFVALHPDTIQKLQLFRGDKILIKVKKWKDTFCIAIPDETCEEPKIRMNKVVRSNLRVRLGDVVSVHQCPDVRYGKHVHILPVDDTIEGFTGNLFDTYLKREFLTCIVEKKFLPLRCLSNRKVCWSFSVAIFPFIVIYLVVMKLYDIFLVNFCTCILIRFFLSLSPLNKLSTTKIFILYSLWGSKKLCLQLGLLRLPPL